MELPTYAFRQQRFWPERQVVVAGGDGAAEAGLWAAVDQGDVAGVSRVLGVGEGAGLGDVLPALASWRRGGDATSR